MSVKIYTGKVVFPPGQPYDGPFGPSINILVAMDDPSAPKTNNMGEVRVYKKESDPDAAYMKKLNKGDRVTLAWNEAGSKSNYSLIYDEEPAPAAPPYSKPPNGPSPSAYINKTLAPSSAPVGYTITVDRQPQGNMEAWQYSVGYELEMYKYVLGLVADAFPDLDPQAQHALAQRLHGWAHGWWRPGAVLAGRQESGPSEADRRDAFLALVKANGEDARAWLVSAALILESEEQNVLDVITKLGIQSSQWLKDDDGKWQLVLVVETYWSLINDGLAHGEVAERLNKQFGVKLPAKEPEPF